MAHDEDKRKSGEGMSKIDVALAEMAELERESEQHSREFDEALSALMPKCKGTSAAPVDQQALDSLLTKNSEWATTWARLERTSKAVDEFFQGHPEGLLAYLEKLNEGT